MISEEKYNRGFIRTAIAIAVALVLLKMIFNIDPAHLWQNPTVQTSFEKASTWNQALWDAYIWPIIYVLWDVIVAAWELFRQVWHKFGEIMLKGFDETKVYKE